MVKKILQLIFLILCLVPLSMCTESQDSNDFKLSMNDDWQMFSSATTDAGGQQISQTDFEPDIFYPVDIPSTVMSGLIQNGKYPDIYFAGQLEKVEREIFEVPWWYRKSFRIDQVDDKEFQLIFEGINYKANIWINGNLVAGKDVVEGPFGMWELEVTGFVNEGENVLAVEIIRPERGDLTIGFVDWSPEAPDRNMGLWRGVTLRQTGSVSVSSPFVASKVNTGTLDEAELTVSVIVRNHADVTKEVTVEAEFDGRRVSQTTEVEPLQKKTVVFLPADYKELRMKDPKLWWPVNLGEPHLYDMVISASTGREVSDMDHFRFGVRQIDEYRNEDDHLGFMVNGTKVLIRGGGWVDDMLLADTDEKVKAQVDYVKHMNMNTIRLEGFWGRNKTLYDHCDEQGIMIMVGWSCQWEWESYSGRQEDEFMVIRDRDEQKHNTAAYTDQVLWLRNHPSVFLWVYGSDKLPRPELETMLNESLAIADPTRPVLSHCGSSVSEVSGTSGVKMNGPYDWVSPNYWYIDKNYGGAYGFNTETGPGPQIPTLESIKKMIPEDQLWPRGELWDYHSGRFEFNNLDRFLNAFNSRYGEADNLEEFIFKNQMSNYESVRPMFEAFAVNKFNSTGVIQWMLNSAWPKIIWQLYDYYLVPNAAFYGTKKACSPLVPIYNYGDNNIYVHNEFLEDYENLNMRARILDIESNVLFDNEVSFDISENTSEMVLEIPEIEGLSTTYFLDLRLTGSDGTDIQNNFYWLSTKEDVSDWENTYWVYTPGKEFADLSGINSMAQADMEVNYNVNEHNKEIEIDVTLNNTSDVIAFFNEMRLVDKRSGNTIVPVFWDDNYVSLLPGESRSIKARIASGITGLNDIELKSSGWNVDSE